MTAGGSGDRALTAGSGGSDMLPTWSPDESRIAFYSNRDRYLAQHVMAAYGSRQERIDVFRR